MLKLSIVAVVSIAVVAAPANGQNVCADSLKNKLVCAVPELYGPTGLVLPAGVGPPALVGSFNGNNLSSLNNAVASQSVLLSLASPAAGITYTWDPGTGIYTPSNDSFGPVFGERADTIGRHRFFVGESYQYFSFSSLDGTSLKHIPQVFTQPDTPLSDPTGRICSTTGDNTGACAFIRDIVTVDTRLDLKVNEAVTFLTYGITNRMDASIAIPFESVRLRASSLATIVDNSSSGYHSFVQRPGCGSLPAGPQPGTNCLDQSFSSAQLSPSLTGKEGVGDLALRFKMTAWRGERSALAGGAEVRLPTGDSADFLGAGAAGLRPFVVWSYRSRISPHLGGSYQFNGRSKIVGDLSKASTATLPRQFSYSEGVDAWLNKRITVAFDFLGEVIFDTPRLLPTTFTSLGPCIYKDANPVLADCAPPTASFGPPTTVKDVTQANSNANILNASIGAKIKVISNLLFTGNVVFKINNDGLRATAVPLGQLSYTF